MPRLWAALCQADQLVSQPAIHLAPIGPRLAGEAVSMPVVCVRARCSRLRATRAAVQSTSVRVGVGLANDTAVQQRHIAVFRKQRAATHPRPAALDTAAALQCQVCVPGYHSAAKRVGRSAVRNRAVHEHSARSMSQGQPTCRLAKQGQVFLRRSTE